MSFQLRVLSGPDEGTSFQIPSSGLVAIGRSHAHSDLCLHDLTLDRVHCEIMLDDEQVVLSDNDSSTGTFLNGERITRQPIKSGDVIRIGGSELSFEKIQEAVAAPPPAVIPILVAPGPGAPAGTLAPVQALEGLAGTVLGHFELGSVLGVGHVGVVFRARDLTKNREVALKVLRPEFPASEDERQRFLQIVKALILLRHPNLVLTYGAGRAGNHHWLALEYVEGESVAELIRQAQRADQPDWRPAFRLAVNVTWALQIIHQQKLVHGNVTPQNILFQDRDQTFKLSDLVTNKALVGMRLWQLVLRDKAVSELPYLAPEHAGSDAPVDGRTDIYSLGTVVYALLVGRPPFAGAEPAETIAQIREAELIPPRALEPSIPEVFDAAVRKMLARRPEDRFQNADELLARLAQIKHDPAWQTETAKGGLRP
jgi:serine/threonine protein kinase